MKWYYTSYLCYIEYHLKQLYRVHYRIPHVYDTPCTAYIYLYEIWCNRTAFRCPRFQKAQRFDTTKFPETTPFGTFDAFELPLLAVSTGNGY